MNRLEMFKSMFALSVGLLLGGLLMIGEEAKRLELVIKDIAGVKERSFRWDLSR